MTMTKKMISRLAFMAVFLIFYSCRTDLDASSEHKPQTCEHFHQAINKEAFQKETLLAGINDFKKQGNSFSFKTVSGQSFLKRFNIDENSIYKMEVNNIQTYSLRAYHIFESPDVVYNLIYRKKGADVDFSIVRILNNEIIPVYDSEKGTIIKIENPTLAKTCTDFYSVEIWNCKEGVSWSQCDKCAQCLFTSSGYISYECGGSTGSSSGGSSSGGGGLSDPSGYTFDPNIPPSTEPSYVRAVRANNFFTQLNGQAQVWATEHVDIYYNILEYYLDHLPASAPPPNSYYWDFANFAIQMFMENPYLTWEQFYNQYISTPCEKTKSMLNRPAAQQIISDVKTQALSTLSNMSAGEIGFKEKKDGTIAPADINASHKVVFNDVTDGYGGYHNHTANGTHMFSPPDVADTLLGFAAAQNNVGDAYFGMIAAEWCTTCPGNKEILHYVIQYTGKAIDLGNGGNYNFTATQLTQFENKYRRKIAELSNTSLYGNTYIKNSAGDLNEKGLEKLFFETLNNMNLVGKVNLQRIEANGIINNVTLDSNGMPIRTPCP